MQCSLRTWQARLFPPAHRGIHQAASTTSLRTVALPRKTSRCLSLFDLHRSVTGAALITTKRYSGNQNANASSQKFNSGEPAKQVCFDKECEHRMRDLETGGRNDTVASATSPASSPTSTTSTTTATEGSSSGFSQGLTDFCWREDDTRKGVFEPSVLHAESMKNRIRLFGMPKGFPATTAAGFRRFFYLSQVNSFIADFSACIGYQSLLSGFFLGSSPQMWMLKDLFPALIAAYMANRLVSYESRPKQWFCVSVLLRNVTIISDMIIPSAVPNHMVLAAIVTAVLKQSSALMFFITRAAALQHYATDNNLAELTKKFNSFSMVTFTLATALAIVYCTFLTSFTAQLTTILVCCVANMALSYLAMEPIAFRILNPNTMQVLLHTYCANEQENKSPQVLTPQEVSDRMGIRMTPTSAMRGDHTAADLANHLLYISPPIVKLIIRSDTLREDILYLNAECTFLLAMWRPSAVPLSLRDSWRRYELPALLSLPLPLRRRSHAAAEVEKRFHGQRLCLLVQHQCTPRQLVTAYLILYTAMLQHAATEAELRSFLQACHAEQEVWTAKGEVLYEQLKRAGWDVELPALDHHDFRLSHLLVQAVEKQRVGQTAEANAVPEK